MQPLIWKPNWLHPDQCARYWYPQLHDAGTRLYDTGTRFRREYLCHDDGGIVFGTGLAAYHSLLLCILQQALCGNRTFQLPTRNGEILINQRANEAISNYQMIINRSTYVCGGVSQSSMTKVKDIKRTYIDEVHTRFPGFHLHERALYGPHGRKETCTVFTVVTWWRHQMEIFSALQAFCGEFTGHRGGAAGCRGVGWGGCGVGVWVSGVWGLGWVGWGYSKQHKTPQDKIWYI